MTTKTNSRKTDFYSGTGRRKEAVARVWLYERKKSPVGGLVVNGQPIEEYFVDNDFAEKKYKRPFEVTGTQNKFSASIKVAGGGKSAQLDAVVLGLARALVSFNPDFRPPLKEEGLLTRDARVKERKKYFLRKARKRPQYSKR
jgi:small subunit ribosomal protein S9